jgi:hypothetical protein
VLLPLEPLCQHITPGVWDASPVGLGQSEIQYKLSLTTQSTGTCDSQKKMEREMIQGVLQRRSAQMVRPSETATMERTCQISCPYRDPQEQRLN